MVDTLAEMKNISFFVKKLFIFDSLSGGRVHILMGSSGSYKADSTSDIQIQYSSFPKSCKERDYCYDGHGKVVSVNEEGISKNSSTTRVKKKDHVSCPLGTSQYSKVSLG